MMRSISSPQRIASLRQRLLNVAKASGEDFQLLLDRFAGESLLRRLAQTQDRRDFVLKGATLFAVWQRAPLRPTRDLDFLATVELPADLLAVIVKRWCEVPIDDGASFDTVAMTVQPIREEARYGGMRIRLPAALGNARCNVQIDVGFGDAVYPEPALASITPILDDLPSLPLFVYPRETVFAEKLEAIVDLGFSNSRMKDYFDLLALIREERMDGETLAQAVASTFRRRRTPIPRGEIEGLSDRFATDPGKQRMWSAFLAKAALQPAALPQVVEEIAALSQPLLATAASLVVSDPRHSKHVSEPKKMQRYANLSGNSGVVAFDLGKDRIDIEFDGGAVYRYSSIRPGVAHVREMQRLARVGRGLAGYIAAQVKDRYEAKLR